MTPKEQHHQLIAEKLIENLSKRRMEGFYCATAEEAVELVSSLIPAGSGVTWGGSMTLAETGVLEHLKARADLTLYDRANAASPEEINAVYEKAFSCDTYLMSTNAITMDGQLLNIDGNGNRVAALIYGPKQVIIVAGMNKILQNLDEAMTRVRNIATPANCIRLNKKTPCATSGLCSDCLSSDCICNQIVTTRRSGRPGRIKVVLVEGSWGY